MQDPRSLTGTTGATATAALAVHPLADATPASGGKAAHLRRALDAGLPVPPGWVVAAETPDADVAAAAAVVVADLAAARYAVRSSAHVEDGVVHSHAGQFLTLLDVAPADLADAVARVRASHASARATSYAQATGAAVGAPSERLPVLVMPMVAAVAAGVAFTRDPIDGTVATVIEAVEGLGDRVVDGTVRPDHYRVDASGSVAGDGVLSAADVRAVARLAARAETLLDGPVDIEFACTADGDVVLLQLRPITSRPASMPAAADPSTNPPPDAPPGVWRLDRDHTSAPPHHWFATWMLPRENRWFADSFAAIGSPLRTIEFRIIDGWPYTCVRPVGAPDRATGGPPPRAVLWLLTRVHPELRRRARAARAHLDGIDAWLANDAARFARTSQLPAARVADLDELDDPALVARLDEALARAEEVLADHFRRALQGYAPVVGRFGRLVTEAVGCTPAEAMAMLGPSPASGRLQRDLAALAEVVRADEHGRRLLDGATTGADTLRALTLLPPPVGPAVRSFLDEHGPASSGGAALLQDEPAAIVAGLRDAPRVAGPADEETDATVRARLAGHGPELVRAWERAKEVYPRRDATATAAERAFGRVLLVLREMGARLRADGVVGDPTLVEDAAVDELLAVFADRIAGRTVDPGFAAVVERRREEREAAARRTPPPVLGATSVDAVAPPDPGVFPGPLAEITRDTFWMISNAFSTPELTRDGESLNGSPGSAGVVRGRVRVLRSLAELDRLAPGDVLACVATTPTWTPALVRAGAVLTVSGGALSHAAIVCRELGIPAVVGLGQGLLEELVDGELVEVDGGTGRVRRLEAART